MKPEDSIEYMRLRIRKSVRDGFALLDRKDLKKILAHPAMGFPEDFVDIIAEKVLVDCISAVVKISDSK